jgi:hypothetical protein
VVDNVFERTFADYDFDRDIKCAIKQSLEMAPKMDEFNPLQHPGVWDELPLYLQRYDFWEKLPKMKGLRSGTLGEWVKVCLF